MERKKKFFSGAAITLAVAAIAAVVLADCAAGPYVDSWGDASVAAEQRAVIEQQRRDLERLGDAICRGVKNIGRAEERLGSLEEGTLGLEDWLERVDQFVREIISVKRELEDVQQPNSEADAGAG